MSSEGERLTCPRCDATGEEPPYCGSCGGALDPNKVYRVLAWLGGLFLLVTGVVMAPSALVITGSLTYALFYSLDIIVGLAVLPPAIRYVRREFGAIGRWSYVVFYVLYFLTHENINQAYFPPLYY